MYLVIFTAYSPEILFSTSPPPKFVFKQPWEAVFWNAVYLWMLYYSFQAEHFHRGWGNFSKAFRIRKPISSKAPQSSLKLRQRVYKLSCWLTLGNTCKPGFQIHKCSGYLKGMLCTPLLFIRIGNTSADSQDNSDILFHLHSCPLLANSILTHCSARSCVIPSSY